MKQGRAGKGAELSITTLFPSPYTRYFVQDQQEDWSGKKKPQGPH